MINREENEFYFLNFTPLLRYKYDEELRKCTPLEREVFLFDRTLRDMPIHLAEGDLFAKTIGFPRSEPLPDEIVELLARDTEFRKRQKERPTSVRGLWKERAMMSFEIATGHCMMDYERVITRGMKSYREEIERELGGECSEQKKLMLEAMLSALGSVRAFADRFASLARLRADEAKEEGERARMLRIADMCSRLPEEPARDFLEAVQSMYLTHILTEMSDASWYTVSLGNLDRILLPFHRSEDREFECEILRQLYRDLETHRGRDCSIVIGGVDEKGRDVTNELSYMILEVERELLMRAPVIAIRVHDGTPKELLDAAVCPELFEIGQPSFYGEEACRAALTYRGVSPEDIEKLSPSGCMEVVVPGAEQRDSWGCVINMHLPLEFALNGGKPFVIELPEPVPTDRTPRLPESIDELWESYEFYLEALFSMFAKYNIDGTAYREKNRPNPFKSMMTRGCIKSGRDLGMGADFHIITSEGHMLANTADAIGAIDELVFKSHRYTLKELVAAAKANYEGYEEILAAIKRVPKYGTSNRIADENAAHLVRVFAGVTERASYDNHKFCVSLHTLEHDATWAKKMPATLDGRRAGDYFAKNAGPSNLARAAGPTAVTLSATRLGQHLMPGGQALDLYFNRRNFETPERRDKLISLIKTYHKLGGVQLQVNSVSVDTLRAAYEKPEDYNHVIVRRGGHSVRFNDLSRDARLEFIERFSIEDRF